MALLLLIYCLKQDQSRLRATKFSLLEHSELFSAHNFLIYRTIILTSLGREGVNKKIKLYFLGDISPKLWPLFLPFFYKYLPIYVFIQLII